MTVLELHRRRTRDESVRALEFCGSCWTWMKGELSLDRVKGFDKDGSPVEPEPVEDQG